MTSQWVCFIALISSASCASLASASPVFTCYTVRRGETASRIAHRITRDANHAYAPWFQILDPAASAFVPKSQYHRIQPGWQACVDVQVFRPAPSALMRPRVVAPAHVRRTGILRWWWAPGLFLATALGWIPALNYLERRQAASRALERFGTSFIREFARPLLQQPCVKPPLCARLRLLPQRDRAEILLAPNHGWHYPNLSDHRKNVEYDVERIVARLGERRIVCGRLATRGRWVVIPFRLERSMKREEP
jgi:hypothetical protein